MPDDCSTTTNGQESVLYAAFRAAALATPHARAVIGYDGTVTSYDALLTAVDTAAERLTARLDHGAVLGLAVDDPDTFVAVYLAAAKLGIVTVLLDSRLSATELARSAAKFDLGWLAVDHEPDSFELQAVGDPSAGYERDDFVVHCTSGSTGEPKGIVMSQAAIMARVRFWGAELELTSADVVLCALPLSHCHGIDVLTLPTLMTGATVVFARGGQLTAKGLARRIDTHGVTLMSGLPIMYQLLTSARGVTATALRTLRMVISGSAPLPVSTQADFLAQYGIALRQVYGLSEIGVICFDKSFVGNGSIGTPIAGVEWRLEPVRASDSLLELYVRGPALARGYYRDPVATAEMFEDGWLRTRDLIHAESDGWYIRGRQSSFINVAGNKVGPLEVEAALRECPGVLECAVIGVPDSDSTERIAAMIVTDHGFEVSMVKRQLSERLLSYQLPQRYEIASALPRTPLGKIDYPAVHRLMRADEVTAT
jgi:acyl-CoA synthetase (AMP-forming)/AMP-acid ligase II